MQFEITKRFLQELAKGIARRDNEFVKEQLSELHPADVNTVLSEFSAEDIKYVLQVVGPEEGAEIIREIDEEDLPPILKTFSNKELARLIDHVDSDDAVDILNEQTPESREQVITLLEDAEKAYDIADLLRYDEDTAGGLMAKELIRANVNWNVRRCIEEIRLQREKVDKIHSIYVVSDEGKLLGIVSLKKIILASDEAYIKDIYDNEIIYVNTYQSEEDVAKVMSKYDLTAIPVVNVQKHLMGRITVDDVIDVIQEQAELERQIMSGISQNVEQSDSVWALSKARIPWLMVGMIGGLLGANILRFFDEELEAIEALAYFIPLIMATGGNVGIQSSTIVVQALANKTGFEENIFRSVFKSFLVALLNGIAISGVVLAISLLLMNDTDLSIVVSIALYSVVILASVFGTLTPLVLDKMGINPALASGPFITTVNDLLGITVYFFVAYFLLF